MNTRGKWFLSYVLASLFCLGVWYYQPVHIPLVRVTPLTEESIKTQLAVEQEQKEFDRMVKISAHIYRRYNCPTSLAQPTAQFAKLNGLPVRVSTAVVIVESSCRSGAISHAGAVGYMQVMPNVHHISRKALLDRDTNLRFGNKYLASLVHEYGMEDGLAHYFGVSEGSDKSYDYAYHVMEVAGYRK